MIMGCCGDKRKLWLQEIRSQATEPKKDNSAELARPKYSDREFEFTGNHSLKITGIATGKVYHFRFTGDRQMIDYHDSFAMMAEKELKAIH